MGGALQRNGQYKRPFSYRKDFTDVSNYIGLWIWSTGEIFYFGNVRCNHSLGPKTSARCSRCKLTKHILTIENLGKLKLINIERNGTILCSRILRLPKFRLGVLCLGTLRIHEKIISIEMGCTLYIIFLISCFKLETLRWNFKRFDIIV